MERWKTETGESTKTLNQLVCHRYLSVNKDPVSSKVDIKGLTLEIYTHSDIYSECIYTCSGTCTPTHTHTHWTAEEREVFYFKA